MAIITDTRPKIQTSMEGIEMTIDTTSRFVYEQYIKIYENKWSFLREITSNAFDAVVELWERDYQDTITKSEFLRNNPIVLGLYADASGHYIAVKETQGIGMSPERMMSYLKITNSTKRESEHQIGAKGIGRLSALAYKNEYYIETVYDGIKYYYMVDFYGNAPKVTATHDMPTNEPNNTVVKVYVDAGSEYQIKDYINRNLCYFENLVVEQIDYKSRLSSVVDKGDYFLGLNGGSYSDLQLVLGSIPYSISYEKVNIGSKTRYSGQTIPEESPFVRQEIILKFDVSDLDVVASRDSLQLNDRTIKIIQDRYYKVCEKASNDLFEVYQNLENESPNCEKSKKILNDIFYGNSVVIDGYKLSNNHYVKVNHKYCNINQLISDKIGAIIQKYTGDGSEEAHSLSLLSTQRRYYNTIQEILYTNSGIAKTHCKGRHIIFRDLLTVEQAENCDKFLYFKSHEEIIAENRKKSKKSSNRNYTHKEGQLVCYEFRYNTYSQSSRSEEIRDIEALDTKLDEAISLGKKSIVIPYNVNNKDQVLRLANLINENKDDSKYKIYAMLESTYKKISEFTHIQEYINELDIDKYVRCKFYEYLRRTREEAALCSTNLLEYQMMTTDFYEKYNLTNSVSYCQYIEQVLKDVTCVTGITYDFQLSKSIIEKELYDEAVKIIKQYRVLESDFDMYYKISEALRKCVINLENAVKYFNENNIAHYGEEYNRLTKIKSQILELYPVTDTEELELFKLSNFKFN